MDVEERMHAASLPGESLSGRLVYVEDEPVNALLMQHWAAQYPKLTLEVALTGATGFAACLRQVPDAVLLDKRLPDMDGLDVLRQCRAAPTLAGVPLVILSASNDVIDIEAALSAGASAYWLKPFDFRALERGLLDLMGKTRKTRPLR